MDRRGKKQEPAKGVNCNVISMEASDNPARNSEDDFSHQSGSH